MWWGGILLCHLYSAIPVSLSQRFQPFQHHFFHIWHLHSLFFFSILFFVCSCFFGPPIIVSGSHVLGCQMCELPVFSIYSYGNFKHSSGRPAYGDRWKPAPWHCDALPISQFSASQRRSDPSFWWENGCDGRDSEEVNSTLFIGISFEDDI